MTENLLKGFEEFRSHAYGDEAEQMSALVHGGQHPDYFIISCIDSRANPGTIFSPKPGTFLAFKAMGAIVRPHKQGTALADDIDDPEIISFIDVARTALEKAKQKTGESSDESDLLREVERQVVLQGLKNIKTYPSVAKALKEGRLNILGWVFDMEAGALLEYSEETDTFKNITDTKTTDPKETYCA